jgi:hypothetical protein
MARFEKKAEYVDAWSVGALSLTAAADWDALPEEVRAAADKGRLVFTEAQGLTVRALGSFMRTSPDDMLICDQNGDLWPCKPGLFGRVYSPVG